MAEPTNTQPDPPPTQGLWAVGWKLLGLSAEQQRGVVALGMTLFLMWFVYDSVKEGRRSENERTALMVRAFESESEKGRQSVADVGKLTVASHTKLAAELAKLELRIADMTNANAKLEQRVGELATVLSELRKKLPPSEVHDAPMPRLKGSDAVGAATVPTGSA